MAYTSSCGDVILPRDNPTSRSRTGYHQQQHFFRDHVKRLEPAAAAAAAALNRAPVSAVVQASIGE